METSTSPEQLTASTTNSTDEKVQVQALLSEARNTKAMIEGFQGAVRGGRFDGGSMMDLAKGMAFLQAIHAQNKAHIDNLQDRLSK